MNLEKNENIIAYHGTNIDNIKHFKPFSNSQYIPEAIFFTSMFDVAKTYGDVIYEVSIISFDSCINIDFNGFNYHSEDGFLQMNNILITYHNKFDVVIIENIRDAIEPEYIVPLSTVYVVFNPECIKILDVCYENILIF